MQNENVLAVRAIASTLIKQLLLPFILGGAVLLLLLIGLVVYLAGHYTAWWLVFLLLLVPLSLVFTIAVLVIWMVLKRTTPPMSKQQRKHVRKFTDRVAQYSELAGTPRFLIAFRVLRDVVRQRPRKYLGNLVNSSGELKRDFEAVKRSFGRKQM